MANIVGLIGLRVTKSLGVSQRVQGENVLSQADIKLDNIIRVVRVCRYRRCTEGLLGDYFTGTESYSVHNDSQD